MWGSCFRRLKQKKKKMSEEKFFFPWSSFENIFLFALEFCEQNIKIFFPWKNCANMSAAVVITWKCHICFWVHNIGRKKEKKATSKFKKFRPFETQKNNEGLTRSVPYLFETTILLFVQIPSLLTIKKDNTEAHV